MNFFSSDAFLGSAMEAFHPGARHEVLDVGVGAGGRVVRTAVHDGGVLVDCPFLDFFEPVPARPARRVGFAPRVALDEVEASLWRPEEGLDVSPLVRWRAFSCFEDFVSHAQARFGGAFQATERKRRKLAREKGELRFVLREDPASASRLLPLLFSWKSAQYLRTGLVDLFASERVKRLFLALAERQALVLSSLYAGDRPAALHAGVVHDGRMLYWVPAHDPALSSCSPGTLLLEDLMRASYAERHEAFDFLLGGEPYKLIYATHCVRVGPAGAPPLLSRLWVPVRERLMAPLRRSPALLDALRSAKRSVKQHLLLR